MAEFTIKIAGHSIKVQSLFESTRDYCKNYLTEDEPEVSVAVLTENLTFEQEALRQEALEEGIRIRNFTDPFLDRAAIQRKVAEYLFDHNVLMLHGSTVVLDGEGFLFTAKCGTGKSTHTRLWREVYGHRAKMVNDDKPFLEITENGVIAHGSPWSGKHGLDNNIAVPLRGICVLERGPENSIWPISPEAILPMLLHQGYCPLDPGKGETYRSLMEQLAQKTGLWQMACNKNPEAAIVSGTAMSKK